MTKKFMVRQCQFFLLFATLLVSSLSYGATYNLERESDFKQLCTYNEGGQAPVSINGSEWAREYRCYGVFSSRNNTINLYDNSVIKADQTFNITNTEFRPVVSSSGNEGTTTLSGAGGGESSLSEVTLPGSILGAGTLSLSNSSIHGNVDASYGITIENASVTGDLKAQSLALINASVGGSTNVEFALFADNSSITGYAEAQSISLTNDSSIGGYAKAASTNSIIIDDSSIGGDASAQKITATNAFIGGNADTVYELDLINSTVQGNVTSINSNIDLSGNTVIMGDATASTPDNGWAKIIFNDNSVVYGQCLHRTDPEDACDAVVLPDPIAKYHFEETSWNGTTSEVIDEMGNHHGTAIKSPIVSSGDPALPNDSFDYGTCDYGTFSNADNSYIEVPSDTELNISEKLTVSAWIKPISLPNGNGLYTIVAKDTNYEFHLNSSGKIFWYWEENNNGNDNTQTLTSNFTVPVGADAPWTHVVITYNWKRDNQAKLYINGQPDSQISNNGNPKLKTNGHPLTIGNDVGFTSRSFDGFIDEVQVFDRTLNNEKVALLYQQRHECGSPVPNLCELLPLEDFNGSLENWSVTSYGTSDLPEIAAGRLVLNQNKRQQSTAASYQYLFPAKNNYVSIEFDHYARPGSGGDGMAIVLSDASVPPGAGAFGGPLGYGLKPGIEGFAGGWLGVGIDEYGNFSKEGAVNPPSNIPNDTSDAIVVRGSGKLTSEGQWSSGYEYITGYYDSDTLDNGQKRRYRVTIDSTESQVFFSIDILNGSDWESIISRIDVMDGYGQTSVPNNFRLSLTGSTGQATNFHEVDNLQVCADQYEKLSDGLHHFEFIHSGLGNTCEPEDIILKACADDSCNLFDEPISVTLKPITTSNGAYWIDGDSRTFTGQVALKLGSNQALETELGIGYTNTPPSELNNVLCRVNGELSASNCNIEFESSGLTVNVSDKYANKPLDGSDSSHPLPSIKFCNAQNNDFSRAKNIDFSIHYDDPTSSESYFNEQPVVVEFKDDLGHWKEYEVKNSVTTIPVWFEGTGIADFKLNYPEAGLVSLNASYNNGGAIGTDSFVSFPYELSSYVSVDGNTSVGSCEAPLTCNGFVAAGEVFTYNIQALTWSDQNSIPSIIKNYRTDVSEKVSLTANVKYPSGNANHTPTVSLSETEYEHVLTANGNMEVSQTVDEVGVFELVATPPTEYLGSYSFVIQPAVLDNVGRFFPAYLKMIKVSSQWKYMADHDGFAYMSQPIGHQLEVQAQSMSGSPTYNYGLFDDGLISDLSYLARTSSDDMSNRVLAGVNWNGGHWGDKSDWILSNEGVVDTSKLALSFSDFSFEKIVTNINPYTSIPDGPFNLDNSEFGLEITTKVDDVQFKVEDFDGSISFNDEALFDEQPDFRYGRMTLDDIGGNSGTTLTIPLRAEFWDGSEFIVNEDDDRSTFNGANVCKQVIWHSEGATTTLASLNGSGSVDDGEKKVTANQNTPTGTDSPREQVRLWLRMDDSGPESDGGNNISCSGSDQDQPWLRYNWRQLGDEDPSTVVTFGIYRGNDRVIYRGESGLTGQ
ncbi:DUF6701 domain-containing protein [Vibrio toranzoniae]|uniref:DUF6701 domain-containing protein n=1 Tax=Vibrio toranzoniae TaxID=1194427 RepID=UPI00137779D3|nr:DUF6701 domain-containing protein [Vibrio toranzoniae]NAZ70943.1 hypothetical protein [Vibrio toranzoniae]